MDHTNLVADKVFTNSVPVWKQLVGQQLHLVPILRRYTIPTTSIHGINHKQERDFQIHFPPSFISDQGHVSEPVHIKIFAK